MRRKKIRTLVEDLLTEEGVSMPPVPVNDIAKAYGARIVLQSMEGTLSGFLYRDESRPIIGVNTHNAIVRQRFTVAHELGHLLLHDQELPERLHVEHHFKRAELASQGTDECEMEANMFAAELLMPTRFLQKDLGGLTGILGIDPDDDPLVNDLAKKYEVSTQAMIFRLSNLRYLKSPVGNYP